MRPPKEREQISNHVISNDHLLSILGAIPVVRDNDGRLLEQQTNADMINREQDAHMVLNCDGVP